MTKAGVTAEGGFAEALLYVQPLRKKTRSWSQPFHIMWVITVW